MQGYILKFTPGASKDIDKLDPVVKKRIGAKLRQYMDSGKPLAHAKPIVNHSVGSYRFKIGDYRATFDVRQNVIFILRVSHRKDIYR